MQLYEKRIKTLQKFSDSVSLHTGNLLHLMLSVLHLIGSIKTAKPNFDIHSL